MGEGFGATQAHPRVQDPRGKRSTPKPARQLRIFYHKRSPQQIFIFHPKGVIHSPFAHLLLKGVAPGPWITPLGLIYKGDAISGVEHCELKYAEKRQSLMTLPSFPKPYYGTFWKFLFMELSKKCRMVPLDKKP
jgi:hypothetical protein